MSGTIDDDVRKIVEEMPMAKANVAIRTVDYVGDDPLSFVLSTNLHRRHLDESQRSMVSARLAKLRQGDNQHTGGPANLPDLTQSEAAKLLNVSTRSVRDRVVQEKAAPNLARRVARGKRANLRIYPAR
jgi:hypothetical protein